MVVLRLQSWPDLHVAVVECESTTIYPLNIAENYHTLWYICTYVRRCDVRAWLFWTFYWINCIFVVVQFCHICKCVNMTCLARFPATVEPL